MRRGAGAGSMTRVSSHMSLSIDDIASSLGSTGSALGDTGVIGRSSSLTLAFLPLPLAGRPLARFFGVAGSVDLGAAARGRAGLDWSALARRSPLLAGG